MSFVISDSRAFMILQIFLVITIQAGDIGIGTKWVGNYQGSYLISIYIWPSESNMGKVSPRILYFLGLL